MKDLQPIIYMFLIIVIGTAFIVANANSISPSTQSQQIFNETFNTATAKNLTDPYIKTSVNFTLAYRPLLINNISIESFVLTNATGTIATLDTDYALNTVTGQFNLLNTTFWSNLGSNVSVASYKYYDTNYVEDSGTRTMLQLIIFFLALGILFAVIRYIGWDRLKELFGSEYTED
jgi:hypothetical protein